MTLLERSNRNIFLIGNPNVGKSLIFNELTGANQKIGNYPGVTLTHLTGSYTYLDQKYLVTDLPGLYSFNSGKFEEGVAHEYIINNNADLIVNIIDGRKLERNLFLTLQLRSMQVNMHLVITFKDKLEKSGVGIDIIGLSKNLGIPISLISAYDQDDIVELKRKIAKQITSQEGIKYEVLELGKYESLISQLTDDLNRTILLQQDNLMMRVPNRWIVVSILMNNRDKSNLWPLWIINRIKNSIIDKIDNFEELSVKLISMHYNIIEEIIEKNVVQTNDREEKFSSRIDKLLLHPVLGFIIFVIIMAFVFKLTYDISAPISSILELMTIHLADLARYYILNELFASFLADALIGGIGFVLVFIPQIAILFFFISVMEHTGYLSRVVFITDRFLSKIGISGTSVASLLLGFGCNVPAVMSTRGIEDKNERIALILVNPFMSCSARLPVYVIIAGALFPNIAGLIIALLYFVGIVIAVILLYILRRVLLPGKISYLLMELPELSLPTLKLTLSRVWLQVRKFVEKAASWMAIGLIIMWVLSITGPSGYIGPEALNDSDLLQLTWIFSIGDFFSPIFSVFLWDSRLIVALIFGFIAKEVVISSFGLIYGVSGGSLSSLLLVQFSPASGLAYLFFVLLYTPCIGTMLAIKQEIGNKWAIFSVIMSLIVAYIVAIISYFIGTMIF